MSHKAEKEYWHGRQETRELAVAVDCGHRSISEKLAFIAEEHGSLSDEEIIRIFEEEHSLSRTSIYIPE